MVQQQSQNNELVVDHKRNPCPSGHSERGSEEGGLIQVPWGPSQ